MASLKAKASVRLSAQRSELEDWGWKKKKKKFPARPLPIYLPVGLTEPDGVGYIGYVMLDIHKCWDYTSITALAHTYLHTYIHTYIQYINKNSQDDSESRFGQNDRCGQATRHNTTQHNTTQHSTAQHRKGGRVMSW